MADFFFESRAQKGASRFQQATNPVALQPETEELSTMRRFAFATSLLLGIPACGMQVSPDYQGEPLATLHGHIASELGTPLPDVDVALLWPDWSKGDAKGTYRHTAVRVPAEADVSGKFKLTLFEPPPETAYAPLLRGLLDTRVADATIMLVKRGVDASDAPLCCDGRVLTYLEDYLFSYVEESVDRDVTFPDGTVKRIVLPKGPYLTRQDRTYCADGFDQVCIDQRMASGESEARAKERCTINGKAITHPVNVPLDTDLPLVVRDRTVLPDPIVYTVPCP
jgi:hypothetical protein